MKATGLDWPVSVEILTGTVAEEVRGLAGTVAWQVVSLGHATGASAGPKVTVIWPSALKKPLPRRVTCWPAAPEGGKISMSTGLAPGLVLGRLEVVVGKEEDVGTAEERPGTERAGEERTGTDRAAEERAREGFSPGAGLVTDVVEVGDLVPAGCAGPRDATLAPLRTKDTPSPAPASRSSTASTPTARARGREDGGRRGLLPLASRGQARHATPIAPIASANAMTAIAIAIVQLLTASMAR